MERIAPSAVLEAQIAEVLSRGIEDNEQLAELGRLGTRLVLQRAVEDEVAAFLGRARYERTPAASGSRNGSRSKPIQTAEGEITIAMPQVRGTLDRFVSRVIPDVRRVVRTRPLEALVIGAYVRGLSDRDIESLLDEAGLGHVSKNAASQVCRELRARYAAFCAKSLAEVEVIALFLDAVYLPTRPNGSKEGVLVAWGYQLSGERVLLAVRLGQRESREDWIDLGRDLTRRGLRSPWLIVTDGAPGLISAVEQVWPNADRGRCTVHKLRNVLAKLPLRHVEQREQLKRSYWAALDEASDPADGERRLRTIVGDLERRYPSAAACLADDLPALCVHLRHLPRLRKRFRSTNLLERSLEEVRRRTKVIGRFPGESSCLSLCWAVLDLVIDAAHGLGLSELDRRHLVELAADRQLARQSLAHTA
ncbi:MAG TPA: IS256 family transposase [Ktedonobacterales bacterium]|nr:IS256 family transposase [Ktedonobacterales bacterium]